MLRNMAARLLARRLLVLLDPCLTRELNCFFDIHREFFRPYLHPLLPDFRRLTEPIHFTGLVPFEEILLVPGEHLFRLLLRINGICWFCVSCD